MDPDATLAEIRDALNRIGSGDQATAVADLVEGVVNLDEWLTKGGFLPRDWHEPVTISAEYSLADPAARAAAEGDAPDCARCERSNAGARTAPHECDECNPGGGGA